MLHLAKRQAGEVHNVLSKTQEINVPDLRRWSRMKSFHLEEFWKPIEVLRSHRFRRILMVFNLGSHPSFIIVFISNSASDN